MAELQDDIPRHYRYHGKDLGYVRIDGKERWARKRRQLRQGFRCAGGHASRGFGWAG